MKSILKYIIVSIVLTIIYQMVAAFLHAIYDDIAEDDELNMR